MKKTYLQPEAEVIWLKMEAIICTSGDAEDLTLDPGVDPWAAPMFSDFPSLF